ncbi:50S ribosomal protein L32 [Candidatus Sumerlaeota bacterium]|nr:50S ribosomal protein L32 [Candidatus Sumerlaeota bacterium]
MPVPKRRRSRARRDRGRTHKKLTPANLSRCPECGTPKLPHRACPNADCGLYRGRRVIEQTAKP